MDTVDDAIAEHKMIMSILSDLCCFGSEECIDAIGKRLHERLRILRDIRWAPESGRIRE